MKGIYNCLSLTILVCSVAFSSGCKDDEEEFKSGAAFKAASATMDEGDTILIELLLEQPVKKTEYVG